MARSSIAAPVVVDDVRWGSVTVLSDRPEPLPADTEALLSEFAVPAATMISNAQRREQLQRLADEQAALRRVATLVARHAPVARVCQAVADEFTGLPGVEGLDGVAAVAGVTIHRYDDDGSTTVMARRGRHPAGHHAASHPIDLGDRLWGVMTVVSPRSDRVTRPVPDCVEVIATAVRNGEAEERLRASRERIVTAADQARRRFERDLHDGAQQRLVSLALMLQAHESLSAADLAETAAEVDDILADLRNLSRGLHPAALAHGGLPASIGPLVRRCPTPVRLAFPQDWRGIDEVVEIACYYVVAEALTNIAKHARASVVDVRLALDDGRVRIVVADDGAGGADPARGSGLVGIADRLEALGGTLSVTSPPGAGTVLTALLPSGRPAVT